MCLMESPMRRAGVEQGAIARLPFTKDLLAPQHCTTWNRAYSQIVILTITHDMCALQGWSRAPSRMCHRQRTCWRLCQWI